MGDLILLPHLISFLFVFEFCQKLFVYPCRLLATKSQMGMHWPITASVPETQWQNSQGHLGCLGGSSHQLLPHSPISFFPIPGDFISALVLSSQFAIWSRQFLQDPAITVLPSSQSHLAHLGGWLQMSSEQGSQAGRGKALTTASDDVCFHLRENNLTQPLPQPCKSCSALQAARMLPTSKAYGLLLRAAATVSAAPVTCHCHFQGIGRKHYRVETPCWPGSVRGDIISTSSVLPVTSAGSQCS